jgi:HJR/Mrr/RecB family endonuclease
VQEVYSAKVFYEQRYKCSFKTLVITNAADFTSNAKTLAKQNGVELIGRKQLSDLLVKYKVPKA